MKIRALLVLAFFLALKVTSVHGQTGFPPFGSFQDGGFDAVNLQNLNANFMIPVVSHPGRGLQFQYALVYNTLISIRGTGASPAWKMASGWTTAGPVGFLSWQRTQLDCPTTPDTVDTNFVFTDPMGTPHPINLIVYVSGPCQLANGTAGYASDASGFFIDAKKDIVYAPDGTKFTFGTTTTTDGNGNFVQDTPTVTDPNGNQLTGVNNLTTEETDWTDTLKQTALKITKVFNGPNGQMSETDYNRLAVDGAYQQFSVKYEFVSVQTNFGCSSVAEYSATNVPLVSEVDLPNGQKYVFTYEATPGFSGKFTGRMQQIKLPTGGTITYEYTGPNGGISCSDGSVMGLKRTISDGTTSAVWTYNRDTASPTTTVTAPQLSYDAAANQTVITFDSKGHETTRKIYKGSASGTAVRTINTAWATNNTPLSRTLILEDGRTQSEIETSYDPTGNLLSSKEHDWGQGTPGTVLRTTTLSYLSGSAYTALNMINRLQDKTVADASGTVKSRVHIDYDQLGAAGQGQINATCFTGVLQQDPNYGCSYTTRGLPTAVTTYTDAATPSGAVTKTFKYDSVGNLVSAQLNCCQQKAWNYSSVTQYAFPDSVVSGSSGGTQLQTSATYYLTTGQIKTSTDENGQVTTYGYADPGHLDRLTDVQRPDFAHLTTTYDDLGLKVTSTSPLKGTDLAKGITVFDGLGRPITQTTEDAANNVYAITDTQYDVLGRPYKTSNPHTGAAQFWTTNQFDAIGRPTLTLLPDNSQGSSSYALNSTIVSDPAGKERKSVTDGIGRLVEVDEPPASGVVPPQGDYATMQTDGNFVLYTPSGTALWATGTAGSGGGPIEIQDDGNFVLYIEKWQAGTYATPSPGPFPVQTCSIGSALNAVQTLASGQCIVSPHGQYMLYMHPSGDLEIYNLANNAVITTWSSGTYNHPGAYAVMQGDGNFCIYAANGTFLWMSGTNGTFAERLEMEDDGRIIIFRSAWNSETSQGWSTTSMAHPGCDVGFGAGWTGVLGSGQCFVSPNGRYEVLMQTDGNLVLYDRSTTPAAVLWETGTAATIFSPGVALQTLYSYGVFDNLLQVTQGAQTRTYVYDGMGRMTDETTPEAGHVNIQYNSFDLVTRRTDARNVVTNYSYTTLNQLREIDYDVTGAAGVPATPSVVYNYGTDSAQNNNGRVTTVTDGLGSENYTYDLLGRVTQLQKTINAKTYTIGYGYNLAGELTTLTYPSGRIIQQSFDAIGRLCEIAPQTSGCGTATAPFAKQFGYNSAFQTTGFAYGNGVLAAFNFSPDRLQLTSLSYSKGAQTLFGLNYYYKQDATNCPGGSIGNNGQIQCITDVVDAGRNTSYAYDTLGRLSSAVTKGSTAYPQWGLSFSMDRYGNLTVQTTIAGSAPQFSVPVNLVNNQISTSPYDANGNLTNDGSNALAYDAESRIASSTRAGAVSTYSYDCKSLRVVKASGGVTTVYIYTGTKVIAEYENGAAPNAPTREYIYAGSDMLAKVEAGATTYYHRDHLSNRMISDSNGAITAQLGRFPYGQSWYDPSSTKWKFTTYERDSESGNDYALARYYASSLNRFTSPDPVGGLLQNPETLNRYAYVSNDPVNFTDPSGQFLTALTLFLDRAGFPNAWASFNEFDLMSIPIRTGTAYLWSTHSDNFVFENYSHADLMYYGSQGEIQLLASAGIYTFALPGVFSQAPSFMPWEFRGRVVALLRQKNDCSDWMSKGHGSAADIMSNVPIYLSKPTGNLIPSFDALTGDDPKDAIYVNPSGRFYSDGPNGLLVGDLYPPGSDEARMAILLHEGAHKVNPPGMVEENGNTNKSDQNTTTVVGHCKSAIEKAINGH